MFEECDKYHIVPDSIVLTAVLRHPGEQGKPELIVRDKLYWKLMVSIRKSIGI
jgi:hypothetical protein